MATTTNSAGAVTIPVEQISVPENVRELDPEHVQALAGSIALQGVLVPLVITRDPDQPDGWLLVAGFHRLAARGIRLVIEEFRTDVTKTRKDGTRGALRVDYGDPRKPEQPIAWIWKWLDLARSAGDLYGRCVVILAAEQYASRLVVPSSQQHSPMRWSSHGDRARKALAKLAGPYLPASLKQLEKAVGKAKADHDDATRPPARPARAPSAADHALDAEAPGDVVDDVSIGDDEFEDEDPSEETVGPGELEDELYDVGGVLGPGGAVYSVADPGL
jgi:ParB-like nuclease domain